MKIVKSNLKKLLTIIISIAIMICGLGNVQAAPNSIQLGKAEKTKSYIAGVSFYYKVTNKGEYLYCLNMHKETASNVKANLVKNSPNITGGLVYILKNGYPIKSITGDKEKDYYITQTAVWWYLDKTTGSTNLGEQFKGQGSDEHNLRHYVKELMEEGYKHRNDSMNIVEPKLAITTTNNQLVLKDGYYVSTDIKATNVQNLNTYSVTLENAPAGTKIIKNNNAESEYNNAFTVSASDTFKIKVPSASVQGKNISIKVKATGKGTTGYMAYEYQPVNSSMQNVAYLEKIEKTVSSELLLGMSPSQVTIKKIDQETRNQLSGAILVVKNSKGEEIAKFTTTENAYVLKDLANDTYTIEEISAPAGYVINTNKLSFTIDDAHKYHEATLVNAKAVIVPDTANMSSTIIFLLGISIVGAGVLYIRKNGKRA